MPRLGPSRFISNWLRSQYDPNYPVGQPPQEPAPSLPVPPSDQTEPSIPGRRVPYTEDQPPTAEPWEPPQPIAQEAPPQPAPQPAPISDVTSVGTRPAGDILKTPQEDILRMLRQEHQAGIEQAYRPPMRGMGGPGGPAGGAGGAAGAAEAAEAAAIRKRDIEAGERLEAVPGEKGGAWIGAAGRPEDIPKLRESRERLEKEDALAKARHERIVIGVEERPGTQERVRASWRKWTENKPRYQEKYTQQDVDEAYTAIQGGTYPRREMPLGAVREAATRLGKTAEETKKLYEDTKTSEQRLGEIFQSLKERFPRAKSEDVMKAARDQLKAEQDAELEKEKEQDRRTLEQIKHGNRIALENMREQFDRQMQTIKRADEIEDTRKGYERKLDDEKRKWDHEATLWKDRYGIEREDKKDFEDERRRFEAARDMLKTISAEAKERVKEREKQQEKGVERLERQLGDARQNLSDLRSQATGLRSDITNAQGEEKKTLQRQLSTLNEQIINANKEVGRLTGERRTAEEGGMEPPAAGETTDEQKTTTRNEMAAFIRTIPPNEDTDALNSLGDMLDAGQLTWEQYKAKAGELLQKLAGAK